MVGKTVRKAGLITLVTMLSLLLMFGLVGAAPAPEPQDRPLGAVTTNTFNNAAAITGTTYSTSFLRQNYNRVDLYVYVGTTEAVTVTAQTSPDDVNWWDDSTLVLENISSSNYATSGVTTTSYLAGRYIRVKMVPEADGMTPTVKAVFKNF